MNYSYGPWGSGTNQSARSELKLVFQKLGGQVPEEVHEYEHLVLDQQHQTLAALARGGPSINLDAIDASSGNGTCEVNVHQLNRFERAQRFCMALLPASSLFNVQAAFL